MVRDHKGQQFDSVQAMCRHYGVPQGTFSYRHYTRGHSLEDSLTRTFVSGRTPKYGNTDHTGRKHKTFSAMCDYWGWDHRVVWARMQRGASLRDALESARWVQGADPEYGATDHRGNEYRSFWAMCQAYGQHHATVHQRLKSGYSLADALEFKPKFGCKTIDEFVARRKEQRKIDTLMTMRWI